VIRAEGLRKTFGNVVAVDNLSLEIRPGEFFSLLGPSGCGKTTLLRLLAGLEEADVGGVWINEQEMTEVPPQRRPVNTVFQSYALFPHLNVRDNIAFGLRMKKTARDEISTKVNKVMETVQITSLASRFPDQLSGGQKQRVALARAVVNEPQVLLLDEPLSALDARLRRELQGELRSLQRRLGMTFVFVTHDQDEALALSDRVALMNHGKIEQLGTPRELYESPRTEFAARFLGGCNIISGNAVGDGKVQTDFGLLEVTGLSKSGAVTLAIRPEKIEVDQSSTAANQIQMEIASLTYTGAQTELLMRLNDHDLRAVTLNKRDAAFRDGNKVVISLPPSALIPLEGA
jgi:spermidine/putrescine transport system ATP-binding protein